MGLEVFERGELPRWAPVRQKLDAEEIPTGGVGAAVAAALARPGVGFEAAITPGTRVALTAGSRGIDRIAEVLAAVVAEVKRLGGEPFIVPAMGSHAGATAEGQLGLLAHYGVTPEAMGCPIRSSMETVRLGEVEDGVPVWFDRIAYEQADVVVPIGRVKPHTDFRGPIESGLCKMLAIGLGKQKGADTFHGRGFADFHRLIPTVARYTLAQVAIPFGIALVENGYSRLALVEAVPAARIEARERELLVVAREKMAGLPGEAIDVLIVDEIGKDISGSGADPNVIGRDPFGLLFTPEHPPRPAVQRVVFRDLTDATEGNATGIGLGDVVLRRAVAKMDPVQTYMNNITSKNPAGARIPITADTDRQAIALALATCVRVQPETSRLARIANTKRLEDFWVSEPLLAELAPGNVEVLGDPRPIAFDADGMLAP